MSGMSTSTVIEIQIQLEAVTSDPFIADLPLPMHMTPARVAEQLVPSGRRRIYD